MERRGIEFAEKEKIGNVAIGGFRYGIEVGCWDSRSWRFLVPAGAKRMVRRRTTSEVLRY